MVDGRGRWRSVIPFVPIRLLLPICLHSTSIPREERERGERREERGERRRREEHTSSSIMSDAGRYSRIVCMVRWYSRTKKRRGRRGRQGS